MHDGLRSLLPQGRVAGKRSVENAIEKNKSGRWRDNPKAVAALFGLAAIILFAVLYFATNARASEPCAPFADLPPDVTMVCHAPSGMWVYDSSVWSRYPPTGVRCLKQS